MTSPSWNCPPAYKGGIDFLKFGGDEIFFPRKGGVGLKGRLFRE